MEYAELPERVRDNVPEPPQDPDEDPGVWGHHAADPTDISRTTCAGCGDDLFRLPHDESCWHCGSAVCYVNERGDQVHGEYINDRGTPELGYNLALDDPDREDPSDLLCGYCEESFGEGNTIVIVTPDGETFGASYESSVIRDTSPYGEGRHEALYEASDDVWDVLRELVLGGKYVSTDAWRGYHTGPGEAGGMTKVSGGWHSSMERSDLSDAVNELTDGAFHREGSVFEVDGELFTDPGDAVTTVEDHMYDGERVCVEPADLDFPVAVMFGRTSNVMSIGIDVYAPENRADELKAMLDETAEPAYAGL